MSQAQINLLRSQYGISFALGAEMLTDAKRTELAIAMDAVTPGPLVTLQNNGVPQWMTNYVDPRVVQILTSPMRAEEVAGGAVQKGDFATDTSTFLSVESTGETAPYGDMAGNGRSGHNANFPQRQAYRSQTITEWGDKQMEVAAKARIDYAAQQQASSALTLRKKENLIYLFGVAGLQNYGLTNDPDLPTPVAPGTGAGGNTWKLKTSDEIFADFETVFNNLVTAANGLVDSDTKMVAVLPPGVESNLTKQNGFGQVLKDRLKGSYPNLRVVKVPEYATLSGGNLFQLIAEDVEGQPTVEVAFNERLRSHGVIRRLSSFAEKKSNGAWGAIWYRPVYCQSMLGV